MKFPLFLLFSQAPWMPWWQQQRMEQRHTSPSPTTHVLTDSVHASLSVLAGSADTTDLQQHTQRKVQ